MQRSTSSKVGDWIVADLYHAGYETVSAANCDHAPKNCLGSPSRQINPSMERADVRCGSFASILACPRHVRLGVISEMPDLQFCRSKASVWT
jgi:hypothetical protein